MRVNCRLAQDIPLPDHMDPQQDPDRLVSAWTRGGHQPGVLAETRARVARRYIVQNSPSSSRAIQRTGTVGP
jgi:hypothetical protein